MKVFKKKLLRWLWRPGRLAAEGGVGGGRGRDGGRGGRRGGGGADGHAGGGRHGAARAVLLTSELRKKYGSEGISWFKGSVCFVLKFALPPFSPPLPSGVQYRAEGISWVKGSVCFVLKFALLPFPPSPLWSANFKTKHAWNL